MGADLVQVYEIGTRFMIDSGWIVPMQSRWSTQTIMMYLRSSRTWLHTTPSTMSFTPCRSTHPHRSCITTRTCLIKAGITEVPDSLEGIGEIGQDLLDKGGAGEVMSLGIYGWFFEQFIGKQGLEYANNGNGRKDAATAVAFDENGAAKNILTAWKDL